MNKYVKKPIPVSAIQWTGENINEVVSFCPVCYKTSADNTLSVSTLEGVMTANVGDYIIQGVEGEFYPCKESIFNKTYNPLEKTQIQVVEKSLHNTEANGARKNVKDIVFWGDGDMFKLLCKASSEAEGWMKSTKAMEIERIGCVVQTTTQQRNPDGSYSLTDAVTFVKGATADIMDGDKVVGRKLVAN